MSHLVQMAGLTVQNFVSAASGIALLLAVIRGFSRRSMSTIGSFWVPASRRPLHVVPRGEVPMQPSRLARVCLALLCWFAPHALAQQPDCVGGTLWFRPVLDMGSDGSAPRVGGRRFESRGGAVRSAAAATWDGAQWFVPGIVPSHSYRER
jgi:hypothetical protein